MVWRVHFISTFAVTLFDSICILCARNLNSLYLNDSIKGYHYLNLCCSTANNTPDKHIDMELYKSTKFYKKKWFVNVICWMVAISCAFMCCSKPALIYWDTHWVNSFCSLKCLPFCACHLPVCHRSVCALALIILWELIGINPGMLVWCVICICILIRIHICVYVYIYIHVHIHVHVHAHAHANVYVYLYADMH